jgi:hypothetical protein
MSALDRTEDSPAPSSAAQPEDQLMAELRSSGILAKRCLMTKGGYERAFRLLARHCAARRVTTIFDIDTDDLKTFGQRLSVTHFRSAPRSIYNQATIALARVRKALWNDPRTMPPLAIPAPPLQVELADEPESLTPAQQQLFAAYTLREFEEKFDQIEAADAYWDYADRHGPPPHRDVAAMTHLEFGAHIIHRYGGDLRQGHGGDRIHGSGGLSVQEYKQAYRCHGAYFPLLRSMVIRRRDFCSPFCLLMAINGLNPCSIYNLHLDALQTDPKGRLWIHSRKPRITGAKGTSEDEGGTSGDHDARVTHLVAPEDEMLVRWIFQRVERATARLRPRAGPFEESFGIYAGGGRIRSLEAIYKTERQGLAPQFRQHVQNCEKSQNQADARGNRATMEISMRDSRGQWLSARNLRFGAIRRINSFSVDWQEFKDRTGHRSDCVALYLERHRVLCEDLANLQRAGLIVDQMFEQAMPRGRPEARPLLADGREPRDADNLGW